MKRMTDTEKLLLEKLENENIESMTKRGRDAEIEMYCSWIGISKHGTTRDRASSLLDWYDSKTYKERLKKYENLKLKMDLKPGVFYGKSVRRSISQYLWLKKIRPVILSQNNYKCNICGYIPQESKREQLQVQEMEEYDHENGICELQGLAVICGSCHSFYHIGITYGFSTKSKMEELINHFTKVNGIDKENYYEYFRLLQCLWRDESEKKLGVRNKSVLSHRGMEVKFRISCSMPYKEEVIKQLKVKNLYVEH